MNIGLVHPYIGYLVYFIIATSLLSWAGNFLKNKNTSTIIIAVALLYYLSLIGLSIVNSIFIIFIFSAGFIINFDLAFNVFWIGLYIYLAIEFIKAFDEIDEKNPLLRKLPIIAIVAPFVISYIIFYFIYYGDKIYNLSPHCQNTQDQNIKICK